VSGGTSRTVSVPSGGTATTTVSVSCITPPGNLQVNTSTTGSSLDPDGYIPRPLTVSRTAPVAIQRERHVHQPVRRQYSVVLSGVAANLRGEWRNDSERYVPAGGTVTGVLRGE